MTSKEKLLKLKNNIAKETQEIVQSEKIVNNKTLEQATIDFFPTEGRWTSACFRRNKEYNMSNLPCHLRNNKWLANMFRENQQLYHYTFEEILDYVNNSTFFQEKRHEYELKIVKWQINWIINCGSNWICDEKYGGDIVYLTPVCDLGVRKGIVDTLLAIGMDWEVIEEGIEKNADMWRNHLMEMAFKNQFEPTFYSIFGNDGSVLEPADLEHKEKWLKMRKYEYYCEHKKSVDKYGVIEPEMIMSCEELKELIKYLDIKNIERLNYVEQCKRESCGYSKKLTK